MRVVTRLASDGDYAAFAALFPELAVADPLPTPEHFRERMLPRVVLALEGDVPNVPALPVTSSVVASVSTEVDDAEVASRFDIDVARLALLRARPATSLVGLRESGALVAFAGFDRSFPGAYPFRAVRPSLAGALLRAIEPQRDARHDFLSVTIERDEALAHALLDAGAELSWELFRMDAAL